MRYALIGTGRIAPNHIVAAMEHQNQLDFIAACDLNPDMIRNAKKKAGYHGAVAEYADYKVLIDKEKPDIVSIATASGSHAEIAIYALSHGAHVMVEKPIALSIADADAMIETARANGRILAVCHQNRFNKPIQALRQKIESGSFGVISHIAATIRWNRRQDYYHQAFWRGTWRDDGGCLMNQCIHNIDLMVWMMGGIKQVVAFTDNRLHPYIEGEDVGLALLKGKTGIPGILEGTVNIYPENLEETLAVFGSKGTVRIGGTSVNKIIDWDFEDESENDAQTIKAETAEAPPNIYGFGHSRFFADVIDAAASGRAPLIDGLQGKIALEVILAIYQSQKTGQLATLPLKDFSTLDMQGTVWGSV
jgi:predicted dehydrogenase